MQGARCRIQDRKVFIVYRESCIMYRVISCIMPHVSFLLFTIYCLLFTTSVYAQETVEISAKHLEYLGETDTYIARGSVRIIYKDASLLADEIHLNNTTRDATATGNVLYEDAETIIKADKMELNLETKRGTLYQAYIFYKSRNYHIHGEEIRRLGEETYSMNKASATTCDAKPPQWYFSGRDVKITLHENVKARDATFYIKDTPVLYTPYFQAPLERQTGLLIPNVGYSNKKGFTYKQGFFWAIKENRDATLYLDYFSKKGIGKGLDYRYIESEDTDGELWIYHLRDSDLARDFLELKSYHNQKLPYDMSGYLKLHAVNSFDYYKVLESTSSGRIGLSTWKHDPFGFSSEERLQKYLESDINISKPFYGGRTYLLGQYRQSLEGSSRMIPQNLPEAGVILDTHSKGPLSFNMAMTGTNFWRKEEQKGQRFDIYPNIYLSTGRVLNFTQKVGIRETAYFLNDPSKNANRELFDLRSTLTTRFFKKYPSLTHSIEPSLEYAHIPAVSHRDIPVFDSVDHIPQTSDIIYSLTNRLSGSILGESEARFRLSQSYSLLDVERPFTPILAEGSLSTKKLALSVNASYDTYDRTVTETISSVSFSWDRGVVGVGKNFRRSTKLDQYSIEAGTKSPLNIFGKSLPLELYGKTWYDLKGAGVQELNLKTIYRSQCWGITVSYTKKPYEYQIMFGIEFRGFGSIKIG